MPMAFYEELYKHWVTSANFQFIVLKKFPKEIILSVLKNY